MVVDQRRCALQVGRQKECERLSREVELAVMRENIHRLPFDVVRIMGYR